MSWWDRAGCLGMNTELFFPQGRTGSALDQADQAKAVCARCPVAQACLEWAVKMNEDSGIWGATTEDERRILRRQRQRKQKTR